MKVAVFFADGFEMIEALTPVDYLRRAKCDVITVSVPSPTMKEKNQVTSSHNVTIFTDTDLETYLSEYGKNLPDAIVCPGGSVGAVNLSNCGPLLAHITECYTSGKLVSAICASPAVVLAKTGILRGKNWTCYPGMEEEVDAELVEDSEHASGVPFVTDGNIVTGAGAGTSEEFAMELVKILCGEAEYKRIHDGTVQR